MKKIDGNELQDWQHTILNMKLPIQLQPEQTKMLLFIEDKKFYLDAEYKRILSRVLMERCYYEEDKMALNELRDWYINCLERWGSRNRSF